MKKILIILLLLITAIFVNSCSIWFVSIDYDDDFLDAVEKMDIDAVLEYRNGNIEYVNVANFNRDGTKLTFGEYYYDESYTFRSAINQNKAKYTNEKYELIVKLDGSYVVEMYDEDYKYGEETDILADIEWQLNDDRWYGGFKYIDFKLYKY